jgi:hypothetical protein
LVVDGEEKSKAAYGVDDGRASHMSSGAVWRYAAAQAVKQTKARLTRANKGTCLGPEAQV